MSRESTVVYVTLSRRYRRVYLVERLLSGTSLLATVGLFLIPGGLPWAVLTFALTVAFSVGWGNAARLSTLLDVVFENPSTVYWAQPTWAPDSLRKRAGLPWGAIVWDYVTLHLRYGTRLQVRSSPEDIRELLAWLADRNPTVHLGNYYNGDGIVAP